jgi:hypothetical protein
MKGFLMGLVVAALVFAGYFYWEKQRTGSRDTAAKAAPDGGAPAAKKKRKRTRGATRVARARSTGSGAPEGGGAPRAPEPEPEPEPEPVRLSAADLKVVGQGDDLSRADVVRMDLGEKGDTRELSQDDIDGVFRAQEEAILECISRARPDAETYVPGRVTVKFRIQRAGSVRGVRVDAPSILQKGGLYGCVKGVVGRMRFPASGGSQIVSYPFSLS